MELIAPVVQTRVARALRRRSARCSRSAQQDVLDLTQDVFLGLLADGGRALGQWTPERGLSLKNFVGLFAERHVASVFRSGRRNPWNHELRDPAELVDDSAGPEEELRIASRELVSKLFEHLSETLSPLGRELFQRLYLREQSIDQIQKECGISTQAVYQWRLRLRKRARAMLAKLEGPSAACTPLVRKLALAK